MSLAERRQKLIRAVRIYPVVTLFVLALAYLAGAFSDSEDPVIRRDLVFLALNLYIFLIPALFIIAFILIGIAG